ncbi:MAG: invasion associated locus B family protein [Cardiobacteriaceae bacterium]|nr:invasion associated locus B family protein [Cardiobacteriaceae bacterium]
MKTTLKIAAAAALVAASITATAKLSEGKAYGDWKGTCQGNECGAVQVVNNDKQEPVGRILLRYIPEAKNVVAFVTVPLGVNLRAGMGLAVDGKQVGVVPFDFCDQSGCNVALPLEGKTLESIKKGNTLQVAAYVANEQQTMSFSLKGVSDVIKGLQ